MDNHIYITKKAYWRTPLAVLALGYTVMGILALLGAHLPAIAPDHQLNFLHLTIGRWLDPVLLALASVIYVRYLDLTADEKVERTAFLEIFWTMAAFGAIIGFSLYPTLYLDIPQDNWLASDLAEFLKYFSAMITVVIVVVYLLLDQLRLTTLLRKRESTGMAYRNVEDAAGPLFLGMCVGAGSVSGYVPFLGLFFATIALQLIFRGIAWLVKSAYAWTAETKPVHAILRWLSGQ
jgi:hypothetical protein